MSGDGVVAHNRRTYFAENVDPTRTRLNVEYCYIPIEEAYHQLFDAALAEFNAKQKRKDRCIENYYEKIRDGKQEKPFYEVIFQVGNKDDMGTAGENAELAKTMNLFDSAEIQSAISTVSEEKAKLEKIYQELWSIFDGIDRNESSANVWQERLREYDIRKDFYEKLSAFAKMVDFLYSSYELFELVGFDQAEVYRKEYLFFKKLKDSVSLRFNDSVDFSRYEDGIRQLLNTYVNAEDAKILIEPLDITNKEKMQEQLARLGSDEAKAEAIQTRQVEVLESQRYVDPIRYMTFMERINKAIKEYLAERDSEKYLSSMEKMAEDYRTGRSSVKYPENIMDDGDAKSFYGAVCSGIKKSLGDQEIDVSDSMGALALDVKAIIVSHTKRDWRDNVIVHRNIKKALDDLLFDYMEEHELDWSLDTIDIIIDEIMMVAKKGY